MAARRQLYGTRRQPVAHRRHRTCTTPTRGGRLRGALDRGTARFTTAGGQSSTSCRGTGLKQPYDTSLARVVGGSGSVATILTRPFQGLDPRGDEEPGPQTRCSTPPRSLLVHGRWMFDQPLRRVAGSTRRPLPSQSAAIGVRVVHAVGAGNGVALAVAAGWARRAVSPRRNPVRHCRVSVTANRIVRRFSLRKGAPPSVSVISPSFERSFRQRRMCSYC
jgi:hypothetical protein